MPKNLQTEPALVREKHTFLNRQGETLSALVERPETDVKAYALFAHCFTCSKNIGTATRIARALANRNFAVMRFDFTGLGNSEGDFANTNFSSNIDDLLAAANYLRDNYQAPQVLIGHSLGGAAVIAAAGSIPEARAIVTIAAPDDPGHMRHLLRDRVAEIEKQGWAHVSIGGQQFTIRKQFLDDISEHSLTDSLQKMDKALLLLHSPKDELIEIEHAYHLFERAHQPKSLISLDNADHLLSNPADAEYAADTISAWASRYINKD
ncbi:MAG: osmotically inducible protein OsmC [Acidithiobacillales bacterium SG8_45]|jgi:alpha/beta superfamily hydrolase|nr:MAG: osmotically inducible protein OsmC [Acidithiobacillales bacterium SG8_45]